MRVLSAAALSAAALAIATPAVANAGGTHDPAYSHPPTTSSQPTPAAPAPEATVQCNESTQAGHGGVTHIDYKLGRSGPTKFEFTYDTEVVPDEIVIKYEGKKTWATPGAIGTNGDRTVTVAVPRGNSDTVSVIVYGNTDQNTNWDYTVHCPA
ncbi:hypothetical protein [Gordonia sp. NPDC003950]